MVGTSKLISEMFESTLGKLNLNPLDHKRQTPLIYSIQNNNHKHDCLSLLIELGASLKVKDCEGNTILHHAILTSDLTAINIILNPNLNSNPKFASKGHRINVNVKNNKGETPFDIASSSQDTQIKGAILGLLNSHPTRNLSDDEAEDLNYDNDDDDDDDEGLIANPNKKKQQNGSALPTSQKGQRKKMDWNLIVLLLAVLIFWIYRVFFLM